MRALEIDDAAIGTLRATIDAYVNGATELTGLELYYELERSTPLLMLHTILRDGPRNRTRSGLQQSYGDHNRLLLLALDRLVAGDVAWFRGRTVGAPPVTDDELRRCVDAVAGLGIVRSQLVALWLGAALHDCGIFAGALPGADVENGVALAAPVLDALCPADGRDLAAFAVHHHDHIKDVFTGEVPATYLVGALDGLDPQARPLALAVLGMIQVAGAASLGEGRLNAFRIDIFDRCLTGDALQGEASGGRLTRLLASGEPPDAGPVDERATAASGPLTELLAATPLHGWHATWRRHPEAPPAARRSFLEGVAETWCDERADHVVVLDARDPLATRSVTFLDGATGLLVGV